MYVDRRLTNNSNKYATSNGMTKTDAKIKTNHLFQHSRRNYYRAQMGYAKKSSEMKI